MSSATQLPLPLSYGLPLQRTSERARSRLERWPKAGFAEFRSAIFAAISLDWKGRSGPLYAWSAAIQGKAGPMINWLADRLETGDRLHRPCRPFPGDEELVFLTYVRPSLDRRFPRDSAWVPRPVVLSGGNERLGTLGFFQGEPKQSHRL